nr:sel1 repeat family protein [Campylobacter sp.]
MKKIIISAVVLIIFGVCAFLLHNDELLYSKISCKFGSQNHCGIINRVGNTYLLDSKFDEAQKLLKFACESKFYKSCSNLGSLFMQTKDNKQAEFYLKMSCDNGFIGGCDNLGSFYISLNEYQKAKPFLELSCEQNIFKSCHNLGFLYLQPNMKDVQKAVSFYKKSCENRFYGSCVALSAIYVKGDGIDRNLSLALEFAKTACDGGIKQICSKINGLEKAAKALELLDTLCKLGSTASCEKMKEFNKIQL